MANYDYEVLRENIIKEMNKQKINQNELSRLTNIKQSSLSSCLAEPINGKRKRCLTLEQTWNIAKALHTTPNDLMGFTVDEQTDSLSDLLNAIFNLENFGTIHIANSNQVYYSDDDLHMDEPRNIQMIYFDIPTLNDVLSEWRELKNMNINLLTQIKCIELWKKEQIEINDTRMQSNYYRDEIDCGMYVAREVLEYKKTHPFKPITDIPNIGSKKNKEIIKQLLSNKTYCKIKFNENEIEELRLFATDGNPFD